MLDLLSGVSADEVHHQTAFCFFWPVNHNILSLFVKSDTIIGDFASTVHVIAVGSFSGGVFLKLAAVIIATSSRGKSVTWVIGPSLPFRVGYFLSFFRLGPCKILRLNSCIPGLCPCISHEFCLCILLWVTIVSALILVTKNHDVLFKEISLFVFLPSILSLQNRN